MSITPTTKSEVPGEIVKIQRKEVKTLATPLGNKSSSLQETYYMKVAKATVEVGASVSLDPDDYAIALYEYQVPEGRENAGEVLQLKWLQLK